MNRKERSQFIHKLRAEERAPFETETERRRGEQVRERQIELADHDPECACSLSEIEPGRFALTIQEEVSHALIFARLLAVEIDDRRTVLDILEDVYVAWYKAGLPLYNHAAGRFSELKRKKIIRERKFRNGPLSPSVSAARREFKSNWTLLSPETDYLKPLGEFLKSSSSEEIPATSMPTAQQRFKEWQKVEGTVPTLLYSARVTPRADEE